MIKFVSKLTGFLAGTALLCVGIGLAVLCLIGITSSNETLQGFSVAGAFFLTFLPGFIFCLVYDEMNTDNVFFWLGMAISATAKIWYFGHLAGKFQHVAEYHYTAGNIVLMVLFSLDFILTMIILPLVVGVIVKEDLEWEWKWKWEHRLTPKEKKERRAKRKRERQEKNQKHRDKRDQKRQEHKQEHEMKRDLRAQERTKERKAGRKLKKQEERQERSRIRKENQEIKKETNLNILLALAKKRETATTACRRIREIYIKNGRNQAILKKIAYSSCDSWDPEIYREMIKSAKMILEYGGKRF